MFAKMKRMFLLVFGIIAVMISKTSYAQTETHYYVSVDATTLKTTIYRAKFTSSYVYWAHASYADLQEKGMSAFDKEEKYDRDSKNSTAKYTLYSYKKKVGEQYNPYKSISAANTQLQMQMQAYSYGGIPPVLNTYVTDPVYEYGNAAFSQDKGEVITWGKDPEQRQYYKEISLSELQKEINKSKYDFLE